MNRFIFLLLVVWLVLCPALVGKAAAKQDYQNKVVNYRSSHDLLATFNVVQIKKELYLAKKLLNVNAIRIFIDPNDFPLNTSHVHYEHLLQFLSLCRSYQLKVELSLFENWSDYHNIATSQAWLQHFMDFIDPQAGITLVALKQALNLDQKMVQAWVAALYPTLRQYGDRYHYALPAHSPRDIRFLEMSLQLKPDLYLYHFQSDLPYLHQEILAIREIIPMEQPRIQLFKVPRLTALSEYDQAWWHRFMFYFAKKYHFAYTAVQLLPQAQTSYPGLLRSDHTLTPAFLYAQIYYQLNRIDLDEHKLTHAFYLPLGEHTVAIPWWSFQPITPQQVLERFIHAYYKLNFNDPTRDFFLDRQRSGFYTFLQFEIEESFVNSHFSRLQRYEVLHQEVTPTGVNFKVQLFFTSALGDFSFIQALEMEHSAWGLKVATIHPPQVVFDWQSMYAPASHPQTVDIRLNHPGLAVAAHSEFLHFDGKMEHHQLWLRLRNDTYQEIDIKPVELTDPATGKIFIPHFLFFDFAKKLKPGQQVVTLIPYQQKPEQRGQLRLDYQPSLAESQADSSHLRKLQVNIIKQSGSQLTVDVFNPNLERALLPHLYLLLESPHSLHQGTALLPRSLLPMEHTQLQVTVPGEIVAQTAMHVYGTFYPVVEYDLNLDEAFRYNVMDRFKRSLGKYQYILKRFHKRMDHLERQRIAREIFYLQLKLKDYAAAENGLREMIAQDAGDRRFYHEAYESLYDGWMKQQQPRRALINIQAALILFPNDAKFYQLAGYLYNHLGDKSHAIAALLNALEIAKDRGNPAVLELLYHLYLDIQQPLQAIRYLQTLIQLKPQVAIYYKDLGYLFKASGQIPLAIQSYERYLQRSPDLRLYPELAELYLQTGNKPKALTQLQVYVNQCRPCEPQYYLKLGYLYKELQQRAKAIQYYEVYARVTRDPKAWETVGELHLQAKTYAPALAAFQQQVALCPTCTKTYKTMGYVANLLGKPQLATSYYERFAASSGFDPVIQRDLAYSYYRDGRIPAAIKAFELVVASGGVQATSELKATLAHVYRQNKQPAKAIRLYHALLAKQPANRRWQKELLLTQIEARQSAVGVQLIETGQVQLGTDPEMHYAMGALYQARKDYRQALAAYRKAIQYSPRNVNYLRLAAACAEQLGDVDAAIDYLRQADQLAR